MRRATKEAPVRATKTGGYPRIKRVTSRNGKTETRLAVLESRIGSSVFAPCQRRRA